MKIGIIGFGNIAKKHFEAISNLENARLEAICEPNIEVNTPGNIPVYRDVSEMLTKHPALDIVTICTPNGLHEKLCLQVLESGIHVICEKPLSLSIESCNRIKKAKVASCKELICVMQNRYSPVSQWLKNIISHNTLGKIFMINVSCYWNRNVAYYQSSEWRGNTILDGGTLFTQFSHYVDSLYWLFGELEITNADFSNFNHGKTIEFEDSGIFNFKTNSGAIGTFNYTTATYNKNFESTFTIIGEKGTIKIAGQYMNTLRYCNIENALPPDLKEGNNIDNLGQVYRSAILQVNGKNHDAASLEDGTEVVRIIEDVYRFKK